MLQVTKGKIKFKRLEDFLKESHTQHRDDTRIQRVKQRPAEPLPPAKNKLAFAVRIRQWVLESRHRLPEPADSLFNPTGSLLLGLKASVLKWWKWSRWWGWGRSSAGPLSKLTRPPSRWWRWWSLMWHGGECVRHRVLWRVMLAWICVQSSTYWAVCWTDFPTWSRFVSSFWREVRPG